MKIAVIAPPWIPVPPPKYGGIELVVRNLVEGLKELGQEVILFGHKDSQVSCRFYPYTESPLYFGMDSPPEQKALVCELALKYAYARAGYEKVDIIQDHTLFNFSVGIPAVHTIHSAATEGAIQQCTDLSKNPKNYFVAVSSRQKERYLTLNPELKFIDIIHHGIDVKAIEWTDKKEDFFLCVGRASWQKGLDTIVKVASQAKVGLIMAIKMIEQAEKDFFRKEIEPLIQKYPKDLFFQLHGEIPRDILFDLFRRAKCTLVSSKWEQPFGLVMVESMACGTPVIAFRRGAASEIIVEGKTGFVVNTEDEMVEAVKRIDVIKPEDCRRDVEENFSREKMSKAYLKLYESVLSNR